MNDLKSSIVNYKYNLNNNELTIIISLLSQIKLEDNELTIYSMKIIDNSVNINLLIKNLLSKTIEIHTSKESVFFNWLIDARYDSKSKILTLRVSESSKNYLLNLKKLFTENEIQHILKFSSVYSKKIYMLLKQYRESKILYIEIDKLMDMLFIPKSYRNYGKFKQAILQIADKELKTKSDIYFTLEEEKDRKKITALVFKIYTNITSPADIICEPITSQYNEKQRKKTDKLNFIETLYILKLLETIHKKLVQESNDKGTSLAHTITIFPIKEHFKLTDIQYFVINGNMNLLLNYSKMNKEELKIIILDAIHKYKESTNSPLL